MFADLKAFCIFIGYPRSGHSLVGSLLDAHPRMIVAHELDVLKLIDQGIERRFLYDLLLANSERAAVMGRQQTGYSYALPNQWQGSFERLEVLGDKKGGMSTLRLREKPELLERLSHVVDVPLKLVHVVRNPYDNIATMAMRPNTEQPREKRGEVGVPEATRRYFALCETIAGVIGGSSHGDVFHMRHEAFVERPVERLRDLCHFLGEEVTQEYLDDCAGIVFTESHMSRQDVSWSPDAIDAVSRQIDAYGFLEGYSFEN